MDVQKLKNGWLDFFDQQEFTHAVTLKPNDRSFGRSVAALHSRFVSLFVRVNRALLGTRSNEACRRHEQLPAVAIVEGLPDVGHLHCAFKVREELWSEFEHQFAPIRHGGKDVWSRLVPNGSTKTVRIWEAGGWHDYSMKQVWQVEHTDRIIILPEPVSNRS